MNVEKMSMNTYATQDLPLAATLVMLGHSLVGIERTNPKRAGFCFAKSQGLEALIGRYHSGSLVVEPRGYFDALRQVKSRLYGS